MIPRFALASLLVLVVALPGQAEESAPPAAPEVGRVVGLIRVRAGYPQRASVALSALVVKEPPRRECANFCDMRGFHVQLDAGIAAATLSAGYASVVAARPSDRSLVYDVFLGYGFRAALLRSYGPSSFDATDTTYGGIEGSFSIAHVSFTLGCLRRLSAGTDHRWLWTGGLGWGF